MDEDLGPTLLHVGLHKVSCRTRRGSRGGGGGQGGLAPPPPPKKIPPNNLRQHNSQARIQGGQGGLASPYKILDPPMRTVAIYKLMVGHLTSGGGGVIQNVMFGGCDKCLPVDICILSVAFQQRLTVVENANYPYNCDESYYFLPANCIFMEIARGLLFLSWQRSVGQNHRVDKSDFSFL